MEYVVSLFSFPGLRSYANHTAFTGIEAHISHSSPIVPGLGGPVVVVYYPLAC